MARRPLRRQLRAYALEQLPQAREARAHQLGVGLRRRHGHKPGDLEVQAHTLEDMQRRQREQYLDIDRRLQQLETGQAGAVPDAGVSPAIAPMPAPVTSRPPAVQPVTPSASPVVQPPAATDGVGEQAEYDTALAILREGRYAEATQAFNRFLAPDPVVGQVIVLFIIGLAAAEAAIALSIILVVQRQRAAIDVDELTGLRG